MNDSIPVILVGFGWWARNRTVIPILEQNQNLMEAIAVTSLKGKRKEFHELVEPEFKSKGWNLPIFVEELNQALNEMRYKQKPAAVVINTPNRFHFSQAKMALEADMHVYVERPIVSPDDDLEHLTRLAKQKKRLLFTGVQRRLEDTYRYLYEIVKNHYYFNQLSSIRCFLAAGMQPQDWRRSLYLSGGGIVIDLGYHLLDAAAWISTAAEVEIPNHVSGAVLLKREMISSENLPPLEVETTAVGHINLSTEVLLSFDLSYHAPIDSIYERLEIRDNEGAKVTLTRDQSKRSTIPATITHQRPDGSLVEAKALSDLRIKMDEIHFSGTANNTGPLRSFLQIIQGGIDLKNISPCDAQLSLSTWRLVRGIYRLAKGVI